MNKTTKGTIAAGAAVLLLLGGGGTLAYWNSTADLGPQTITAGQLGVAQVGNGTWKIERNGAVADVKDIGTLRIVPGDKLIYEGVYNITAEGQNLAIDVSLTKGAIQPAPADNGVNDKLATRLAANTTFTVNGTDAPTGMAPIQKAGDNAIKLHEATITATINWPFGDESSIGEDNAAKTGKVNLSKFTLNVQQTPGS